MPVLRRPHDHYRGLCPRRRTARPALRHWDPVLIPMTFLPLPWQHPFARTLTFRSRRRHQLTLVPAKTGTTSRTSPRSGHRAPQQRPLRCHHRRSTLGDLLAKPSTATAAQTSNRHSRPGAHRLPAGSFIGGFRTPAPLARVDRSRWAGIRNPNRNRPLA